MSFSSIVQNQFPYEELIFYLSSGFNFTLFNELNTFKASYLNYSS